MEKYFATNYTKLALYNCNQLLEGVSRAFLSDFSTTTVITLYVTNTPSKCSPLRLLSVYRNGCQLYEIQMQSTKIAICL